MKKILFSLIALFAIGIECSAQTFSVAGDVEALSAGETVSFKLHVAGVTSMTSTHFEIVLPSAFSVNAVKKNSTLWDCTLSREGGVVGAISSSDDAFTGEGDLFTVEVTIPAETALGSYPVTINNIRVNGNNIATTVEFNIVVVNAHTIILDETSTTAPEAANGVNVKVNRTINANEWSTICLPFAMSEAQCKAAFGDDVQLANLTGWQTTEWDTADKPTAISVTFANVSAIEANHPYIIKVSSAITSFTVDGVDIDPENEPGITVGKMSKGTFGSFTGSYVPVLIDEECLFLNSNKFWYSVGKTTMKGYRAYFYFQDVLADYSASGAPAFSIIIGGETTNIKDIKSELSDDFYYNLGGQRVEAPVKGLYIQNGKKIIVK